jgi:hypothetical protein
LRGGAFLLGPSGLQFFDFFRKRFDGLILFFDLLFQKGVLLLERLDLRLQICVCRMSRAGRKEQR